MAEVDYMMEELNIVCDSSSGKQLHEDNFNERKKHFIIVLK